MSDLNQEFIIHTVKDNNKKTKQDLDKLSEYLNNGLEIMTTFNDDKNEMYFLLHKHQHHEEVEETETN